MQSEPTRAATVRTAGAGAEAPAIRRGGPGDIEALMPVWAAAARQAHPFVPGEGRGARAREVRGRYLPAADLLIAETAGGPLGFAAVIGDTLAGLFVAPAAQGAGIGRALLAAALEARPGLTVPVFLRNARARDFYRRNGLVEIGRGLDPDTAEVVVHLRREGQG